MSEKTGTADNICARVCGCVRARVHRDATFDKHEEITMRCYQRVSSLAGGWRRAPSVIFSDVQKTRDDASYLFAQAHLPKQDTCTPTRTQALCTFAQL